jgi:hypothetical protein
MQMQLEEKIIIVGVVTLAAVLSIGTIIVLSAAASAYLKIDTPKSGDRTIAGQFLTVIGTSIPSNATRTHCTVMLKTNDDSYKPVTPLGPKGTYTDWKGTTSMAILPGNNQVEAKFQCFAPGNMTVPNFVHHLVHNFTGGTTLSGPTGATTTTNKTTPTPTQGNSLLNTTQ